MDNLGDAEDEHLMGSYSSDVAVFYEIITQMDWREPWLFTLISIHILILGFILYSRKSVNTLALMLAVLGILCLASSHINEWAAENWERFAHFQYFDAAGLFTSVVFSIPLLFHCTLILILLFLESCDIMHKIAVMRLRQKRLRETHNATKTQTKKKQ